eukprot:CAMPEP_0198114594 /NCGR_PEP_ID=MMETSP1442-20131203/5928_1 /TAXON_ID= /ORGANISM="Craspedostauros australis, Strain CCMP3328" /LENGTH=274 /DNA_ID=CAMNT_0043771937 /DNA_START=123 /DNA_END=947 /DNA_ORIENTATION=+
MKISPTLAILAAATSCSAFAPSYRSLGVRSTQRFMAEADEAKPLEEAGGEDAPVSDPYAAIGIEKEELAIGVDAGEVLKWIGTKQALVEKFQRDNKGMDEGRADEEVLKFYMDAEMLNAYIKFEQDKVLNPPDYKAEAEATLSDPKTIATYAAWLIGGASFGWIRNTIVEPKYASGEWEEIRIELPTMPWMEKAASEAAASKAAAVPVTSDVVAPAVESAATPELVTSTMEGADVTDVADVVSTLATTASDAVTSTVESLMTEGSAAIVSSLLP